VRRLFMGDEQDRLMELFNEARARRSAEAREAYLTAACGGDAALRRQVEVLLQAHAQAGDFLKPPSDDSQEGEGPGTVIGRYKLCEKLGEGGFGVVYMAAQEEPVRRRVALKIVKLGMDTRQIIARFEAERQALALMDHPNIAKVLDAGATETGRPYFVMELVRGVKLTDYCDEHRLSTEERLNLFVQVCHAIQHAHQKGVIHRDIKPSNILVTVNDGMPVPKVIDFGIAKAIGPQLTDKTVFTAFEQFIGTPAYVSPEQAVVTSLDIDTRSDIYALGVLLYELLTSYTPFEQRQLVAAGLDEMRRIIREQEPARPSTRLSTLTDPERTTVARRRHSEPPQLVHLVRGDLDWIVMKCLEKDRDRRYETANGLAADVARHLRDEPVVARPPSLVDRLQKSFRRHRLLFTTTVALGLALLLAVLVSTWQTILALVLGASVGTWQAVRATRAARREAAARLQADQAARVAESQKERAEKEAQRAVAAEQKAKVEADKSQQVAQFLKAMLKGVGPSAARGRDTTMLREILDKTVERVGNDLKDQPAVQAELRHTLGWVYADLGDDRTAETLHRDALTLRRKLYGNAHREVADSLAGLGLPLVRQGKLAEAETVQREALAIRRSLFGDDNLDTAQSLNDLALVVSNQGKPVEAEAMVREALAIQRQVLREPHPAIAWSLLLLATTLSGQGKPAEAETIHREALAMQWKLQSNQQPVAALSLDQLGLVLAKEGKFAEAKASLIESLVMYRELKLTSHLHVQRTRLALAKLLACEGKLPESEPLYREALGQLHKGAEQGDVETQKEIAWQLATCLLPALRDGIAAVSFAEKAVAATNRKNAGYLDTLAAAYAEAGQFAKAVATEKEAIALMPDGRGKESFKSRLKLYESDTPYRDRGFE